CCAALAPPSHHRSIPLDRASRAAYLTTLGCQAIAGGTVHDWHSLMSFFLFVFGSGLWVMSGGASQGEPPVPGTRRQRRVPGQVGERGESPKGPTPLSRR